MIDTLTIARQSFDLPWNKLDYLAEKLWFGGKTKTDFDLWRRSVQGDVPALKDMEAYCARDVVLLEHVFQAITPYARTLPRLVDTTDPEPPAVAPVWTQPVSLAGSSAERTPVPPFPRPRGEGGSLISQ